jgi:hypothetical protein
LQPILLAGFLAAALGLSACGSNAVKVMAERQSAEAVHMQEHCRRTGLANDETQRADKLLAAAQKHLKDGDEEPARAEADLAGTLYRLALARKELADTQSQVDALRTALAKDQDQLTTYQEVLEEIKTRRKP